VQEYERKIKHLEKKYEKTLAKMNAELARYKKMVGENDPLSSNCEKLSHL
jgi:hypothetical protein